MLSPDLGSGLMVIASSRMSIFFWASFRRSVWYNDGVPGLSHSSSSCGSSSSCAALIRSSTILACVSFGQGVGRPACSF